jgi:hypothetical protein
MMATTTTTMLARRHAPSPNVAMALSAQALSFVMMATRKTPIHAQTPAPFPLVAMVSSRLAKSAMTATKTTTTHA